MTAYRQKALTVYHTVNTSDIYYFLLPSIVNYLFSRRSSCFYRILRQHSHANLSVLLDMGSQCNQSPSPRPHTDTSNPANWSRHLIQQTLMDEGLRLARMVSHDRAGKISLGSEGTHSTGDFSNNDLTVLCAL